MKPEEWRSRFICDSQLHHGEPRIRDTRVAVPAKVASLTDFSINELLKQYPQFTREEIQATAAAFNEPLADNEDSLWN